VATRLLQGMVAACAAAALLAPAAGASTVSYDATGAAPLTTFVPDAADTTHHLTLGPAVDPGRLLFNDTLSPVDLPLAGQDAGGCQLQDAPGAATCPAGPVTITLGPGDDALEVQDGVDDVNVDASAGTDQLTLARTTAETVNLTNTAPATAPSGLTFAGFENVTGGSGADTFTLPEGLQPLSINGGVGSDRLDFSSRASVSVDLTSSPATTGVTAQGIENVTGTGGDDTITGDAGPNRLSGGDGVDVISGGDGANNIRGGAGGDTLNGGADDDTLVGGAGVDTMSGNAGDDDISAADGTIDNISCGPGFDTVSADANDNIPADGTCEEVTFAAAVDPTPTPTPAPQPAPDPVVITDTSVVFVPVLGSVAPVLAPGTADITDLVPPRASMRSAGRQRIPTVLKRKGVPVRVTCAEACGISVALSVDRVMAKRLKLDSRTSPIVIGTATAKRSLAGSSVLRVKLTKGAKAGLKATKRNIVATSQVLVSDASGNGTLLSRHITLVR
jgi:hypothetical protein